MVVTNKDMKTEIKMSRDIMEYEMNSGKLFDEEEKMTRTQVVDLMMNNAKQSVMTVHFNKKIDEK